MTYRQGGASGSDRHGFHPLPRRGVAVSNDLLGRAVGGEHHEFWPCDSSGGRFVTFDRSLSLEAVHGATDEHLTVL